MQSSALDEETARSELYGLLALCYYAQPTTEFIANLRVAATETPAAGAFLEASWRDLVGVAREMTPEEIQSEYQALFGGIGKPEVYLYGSHFLSGFLNEKPLARLRTDLTSLGLARDDAMSETEDHVAYLFEVMRFLIAGEDVAVSNLTQQQKFFSSHLQPWVLLMCDDLQAHPKARFYSALGALTSAFMGVETQGFDMMDTA
jgi:TorA maturation chaperone TorD